MSLKPCAQKPTVHFFTHAITRVIINVGDIMSPDAHSGTHTFNFVMKRAEAGDIPDRASDSSDSSQGSDASTSSKPMERVPAARAVSDPHHKSPMEPGATGTTPPKQAKGSQSHIPALNIGKPKSPMFEPESEDEDTETPQLPTTPHSQTPESASPNPKPENQEPKAVAPVLEAPGPVVHDDEADDELASKTITLTLSGTGAAGDRPTL